MKQYVEWELAGETEVLWENLPQCISFFGSYNVSIADYADLSLINSATFVVLNWLRNWALIPIRWRNESIVQRITGFLDFSIVRYTRK
jgi:hypothetical protein